MFESLRQQIGGGKDCDFMDHEHVIISNIIKQQSERNFPRESMCNRLIDGTKCQSFERKGNLFCSTLSSLGAPLVHHLAFSAHISLKNGLIRMI